MKKFLLYSVLCSLCLPIFAFADDVVEHVDEPAVVNSLPNAWGVFKAVVVVLAPTAEMIYDFEADALGFGTSGSVYEFTSNNVHLGRIKAGYLSTNTAYAGVDVDFPGVVSRYLQGRWAQLDTILGVVGKYASTGYVLGYDTNEDRLVHGISLGATLRF